METKDTVMSVEQIGGIMQPCVSPTAQGVILAQQQAEISFKAGKQEGIKEVVKWVVRINRAGGSYYHNGKWLKTFEFQIPSDEWQAKLKEWGVK